jgi:hypothetical protein
VNPGRAGIPPVLPSRGSNEDEVNPRYHKSFFPNFVTNRISAGIPLLGAGPDRIKPDGHI